MMCQELYVCLIAVMILLRTCANTAPVSESTDVRERLSGQFLLSLGTNNSSPLLRMLGKTFMNYENDVNRLTEKLCQLHPCEEWESWTKCSSNYKGEFSMITRSRDCNRNDSLCANKKPNDWSTGDSRVCEGSCPKSYNFTNGYCLKLFTTDMAQYDAQAACEQDGGHLVNTDTKAKSDAVHAVLTSHGITSEPVWINGNRTQKAGAWQFTYGTVPDFDNWKNGEPSNGSLELCKADTTIDRQWYDRYCSDSNQYVCEVI